jgi:hypothetical protein
MAVGRITACHIEFCHLEDGHTAVDHIADDKTTSVHGADNPGKTATTQIL